MMYRLLVMCSFVTFNHCFSIIKSNGTRDKPGQDKQLLVVKNNADAFIGQSTIDNAAQEQSLTKEMQTTEKLKTNENLTSINPLHGLRRDTRVKRRISSATLRRILKSQTDRKKFGRISKKQLPSILAKLKKSKNRRKKAKHENMNRGINGVEAKESLQKAHVITDTDQQQKTPTNEINLTVHVDMSDPQQFSGSSDKRAQLPFQSFSADDQKTPFITFDNVLGLQRPFNQTSQNSLIQAKSVTGIAQRQLPTEGNSVISGPNPNRQLINTKPVPVPVFSDPIVNSRLLEKYLKNNKGATDEPGVFYIDNRDVLKKKALKEDIDTRPTQVSSGRISRKEKQSTPLLLNNMKLPDEIPSIQRLQKERNQQMKTKIVSGDFDTFIERKEDDRATPELKNLLTDIKAIVKTLKPLMTKYSSKYNEQIETDASEQIKQQKQAEGTFPLDEHNFRSMESIYKEQEYPRKFSGIPFKDINKPNKSNIIDNSKRLTTNHEDYNKTVTVTNKMVNLITESSEKHDPNSKRTHLTTHSQVTTSEMPSGNNRPKLETLDINDFLEKLQNLNIISDREINMFNRLSPTIEKKRNKVKFMFSQLMRRKYFRKNVEKLLDTATRSNIDVGNNTQLITALIQLEEQMSQTKFKENVPLFSDESKLPLKNVKMETETNVNTEMLAAPVKTRRNVAISSTTFTADDGEDKNVVGRAISK